MRATIKKIGLELIRERREAVLAESKLIGTKADSKELGKDLLSVLSQSSFPPLSFSPAFSITDAFAIA